MGAAWFTISLVMIGKTVGVGLIMWLSIPVISLIKEVYSKMEGAGK